MRRILLAGLAAETIEQLNSLLPAYFEPLKLDIATTHAEAEMHMEYTDFDAALIAADLRLLQRLRGLSLEVPFVVIGVEDVPNPGEYIQQGAQDILLEAELSGERLMRSITFAMARQERLNELHGFVRLEREIGGQATIQPMLDLVTDLIVRRTGAKGCLVAYMDQHTQTLQMLARLGRPSFIPPPLTRAQIERDPTLARIFNPNTERVQLDIHNQRIILTLEVRGERQGFITLEDMRRTIPNPELLRFYKYVATRVGLAISKLLTYELAEYQTRQMQRLYEISMSLTTTMQQDDMMEIAAWGLVNLLEAGGAFSAVYDPQRDTMTVLGLHGKHTVLDYVPGLGTVLHMSRFPRLMTALRAHHTVQMQALDPDANADLILELETLSPYASIVMPMPVEGGLMGMLVTCETETRIFSPNDLALGQSIALQLVNVMQQAILYKEVAELEQLKTEMIQRASHDLKNPIHVMAGYFELLTETLPEERDELQQAAVESINQSLETMSMLVEDILTLERVENQRNISYSPVDIAAVTFDVAGHLQRQAELKQQQFVLELPQQQAIVSGEETQIRQVLQNLINNAIKYTPDEGRITVRANTFEGDFYFEVEDTGFGIPQDRQEKLFERFYRAKTPGTEAIKGSGLGLYLVKQVVERHQGSLWFNSTEGEGSTFGFCIPLRNAD